MPDPQTFFLLQFALFYSVMHSSLSEHYVFSWQQLQKGRLCRTFLRLGLSYGLFILLPIALFYFIYRSIPSLSATSPWTYIYITFASLTVFVPYRIYHFIDCKWQTLLYYSRDESALQKHLLENPWGHLYAIVVLLVIPFIIWLFIQLIELCLARPIPLPWLVLSKWDFGC